MVTVLYSHVTGPDPLPLDRFMIPREHPVKQARGFVVWPRSIASARAAIADKEVDIHAVHIPNGSSNQWIKIDHLWALRYGLAACDRSQIVAGDFNTPQAECDGKIVTFGQRKDGSFASETYAKPPYTVERPWDSRLWDKGERAVLEGLPRELDMPDAFRELHPGAQGFTWGPRGREPDRRLDHVFVSKDLGLQSCEHLVRWREHALSDHCPILVGLAPLVGADSL